MNNMVIIVSVVVTAIVGFGYGFIIGYATIASELDAERRDAELTRKVNTGICNPIVLGIRCDGCKYEKHCCEKEVE